MNGDGNTKTRTAIGAMLRDSVIPRLAEGGSRESSDASKTTSDLIAELNLTPGDIDEMVHRLIEGDDSIVVAKADALLAEGHGVSEVILGFLAAIAERLGDFWVRDLCSFADVTLGMSTLHTILRSKAGLLSGEIERACVPHSILITPVPGQTHVFGTSVVEEFFRAAGWDVSSGIYASEAECMAAVSSEPFDIVGLSVGAEKSLEDGRRFVARIRSQSLNKDVKILIGGPLFAVDPEKAASMGADATAMDAPDALRVAQSLLMKKDA